MLDDATLKQLLISLKTIAVVGLSKDITKPSHQVATYLKHQGYEVIPINPTYDIVLESVCYPNLLTAAQKISPQQIQIVDIFRRPEQVVPHVIEAIKINAKLIWLQEGIVSNQAYRLAKEAQIPMMMDVCLKKTHRRLFQQVL